MTAGEIASSVAIGVLGGAIGAGLLFATLTAFAIWRRVLRDASKGNTQTEQDR